MGDMEERDIVDLLRAASHYDMDQTGMVHRWVNLTPAMPDDAADEIERLRAALDEVAQMVSPESPIGRIIIKARTPAP